MARALTGSRPTAWLEMCSARHALRRPQRWSWSHVASGVRCTSVIGPRSSPWKGSRWKSSLRRLGSSPTAAIDHPLDGFRSSASCCTTTSPPMFASTSSRGMPACIPFIWRARFVSATAVRLANTSASGESTARACSSLNRVDRSPRSRLTQGSRRRAISRRSFVEQPACRPATIARRRTGCSVRRSRVSNVDVAGTAMSYQVTVSYGRWRLAVGRDTTPALRR